MPAEVCDEDCDFAVVGGGIFGSVVAACLRRAFPREFTVVVDDGAPGAGSPPAACLMKPGWLSGLDRREYDSAVGLLRELYSTEWLDFRVGTSVTRGWLLEKIERLPPSRFVLRTTPELTFPDYNFKFLVGRVLGFAANDALLVEREDLRTTLKVRRATVFCTGVFNPAPKWFSGLEVRPLWGASFLHAGAPRHNEVRLWAPYRQLVGFSTQVGGPTWVGDGSSIIEKNWGAEKLAASRERCGDFARQLGAGDEAEVRVGARPYVKSKRGLLRQLHGNVWYCTGGAKNGTVLSAVLARELVGKLGGKL